MRSPSHTRASLHPAGVRVSGLSPHALLGHGSCRNAPGALLLVIGIALWFLRSDRAVLIGGIIAAAVLATTLYLPGKIGYCQSPNMPCNYGMVPAVRFIGMTGLILISVAVFSFIRSSQKKGKS